MESKSLMQQYAERKLTETMSFIAENAGTDSLPRE